MGIRHENIREFILWAFLLSWSIGGVIYLLSGQERPMLMGLLGIVYMFGPLAASVIVLKRRGESLKHELGIRFSLNTWWVVACLLPVVIAFGTLGISVLFPGVDLDPSMSAFFERFEATMSTEIQKQMREQIEQLPIHPTWLAVGQGLIAGVTINAVAAFGEEAGWRGLLQMELAPLGFWTSAALIGLLWGIWHAPFILQGHNYPTHPVAGVFMMTLFTLVFSPTISYVRLRAQSVIAAAVLHGTFNGVVGIALMLAAGGSDLLVGGTGAAGILFLCILNLLILVHDQYLAGVPIEEVLRRTTDHGVCN